MEYRIDTSRGRIYTHEQFMAEFTMDDGFFRINSDMVESSWNELKPIKVGYDSAEDTLLHIKRVNHLLLNACAELMKRAQVHDDSKLLSPEKSEFDRLTPILKGLTYDTPAYYASLKELNVALDHHYANNSHHPQFYPNGIDGMDLFDVLEMLLDWKAATERHADGDIDKSITANAKRFEMSDQLVNIFRNTVKYLK